MTSVFRLKDVLMPFRNFVENALAPYVKKVTSLWTNTRWFKKLAKKVIHYMHIKINYARSPYQLCAE